MLTALHQGAAAIRKLAAKRRRQALMRSARVANDFKVGCLCKTRSRQRGLQYRIVILARLRIE
jgi:hypothetical protein